MHTSIATESLDTKAARRVLINNIKWLQARMQTLDMNTGVGHQMFAFYASKINIQKKCLRQIDAQHVNQAA